MKRLKVKDVFFRIGKHAFRPKSVRCSQCDIVMERKEIEVEVGDKVFVRLQGFECSKCGKRYIGLDEAKKLDAAMPMFCPECGKGWNDEGER
jgi:hypothetical protein